MKVRYGRLIYCMIACHVTTRKKQQMSAAFWAKLALLFSTNIALMMMFVVANWCTFSLGGNKFVKFDWVWLTQIVTVGKPAIIIYPLPGWPNFILSI